MYLKKVSLKNIKSFADLELYLTDKNGEIRKWTTLFGKNGLGKSTLLQAIGVALAGPAAIRELLPVAENWVRRDYPYGEITAELIWTKGDSLPPMRKEGRPKTKTPYSARYIVTGTDPEQLPETLEPVGDLRVDQILQTPLFNLDSLYSPVTDEKLKKHQKLYKKKQSGHQLSELEEEEYKQLSIWREDLQMLTSPEERKIEQDLGQVVNQLSEHLKQIE